MHKLRTRRGTTEEQRARARPSHLTPAKTESATAEEQRANNENQLSRKATLEQALRSHAGSQLITINMQQATCNSTTRITDYAKLRRSDLMAGCRRWQEWAGKSTTTGLQQELSLHPLHHGRGRRGRH